MSYALLTPPRRRPMGASPSDVAAAAKAEALKQVPPELMSVSNQIDQLLRTSPEALRNQLVADSKKYAAQSVSTFVAESGLPPEVAGMATEVVGKLMSGERIDPDALARNAVALGAAAACSALPGGVIAAPVCSLVAVAVYPTVRDGIMRLTGGMTAADREKIASQRRVRTMQGELSANYFAILQMEGKLKLAVESLAKQWMQIRLAKLETFPAGRASANGQTNTWDAGARLNFNHKESVYANPFRYKPFTVVEEQYKKQHISSINLFLKTVRPLLPFLRSELRPEHYLLPGDPIPRYANVQTWMEDVVPTGGIPVAQSSVLFKPVPAGLNPAPEEKGLPLWAWVLKKQGQQVVWLRTDGRNQFAIRSLSKTGPNYNDHLYDELPFACFTGTYSGAREYNGLICKLRDGAIMDDSSGSCADGFIISNGYTGKKETVGSKAVPTTFSSAEVGRVYPTLSFFASTEESCRRQKVAQLAVLAKLLSLWAEVVSVTPPLLAQATEIRTRDVSLAKEKQMKAQIVSSDARASDAEEKAKEATAKAGEASRAASSSKTLLLLGLAGAAVAAWYAYSGKSAKRRKRG